jgi:uncharacterized protein YcaQ
VVSVGNAYPLSAVRDLVLRAQGLAQKSERTPRRQDVLEAVKRVGWLQIDTLQVVRRSQELVLWSRLGTYDTEDLARLVYDEQDRHLFEGWQHAACFIPLVDYRFQLAAKRANRRSWGSMGSAKNRELVKAVLARIEREGPMRAGDFDYDGPRRGSWWDWKPAKRALELLVNRGDLMVSSRVNFQRVYDLTGRVLPDWTDITEPTQEQTLRHLLERSILALGACRLVQIADYAHLKRRDSGPALEAMVEDGTIVQVIASMNDGTAGEIVVHRDNLPTLERAADGEMQSLGTTFLSPFDSLFWAKGRDENLWSFHSILEAYKPEPTRIWGYFCMPILDQGDLIGRFDPVLDRRTGTLRLKALYLEDHVDPDEALIERLAGAMRDFMKFHSATDLVVDSDVPKGLVARLVRLL